MTIGVHSDAYPPAISRFSFHVYSATHLPIYL